MPHFFIDPAALESGRVIITGGQAAHLAQSLRAQRGERIVVADGRMEHGVVLESVTRERVVASIQWSREATGDPRLHTHVLQAIPARGMDETVEALALAGAASIRPVITARVVARPSTARSASRVSRWRSIAREASQLAGRARPPEVHEVTALPDALAALQPSWRILACMVDAARALAAADIDAAAPHALVIGPEGGLAPDEQRVLQERRVEFLHLGPRVFPARLAGFAALMLLQARAGDLAAPALPEPAQ